MGLRSKKAFVQIIGLSAQTCFHKKNAILLSKKSRDKNIGHERFIFTFLSIFDIKLSFPDVF
jgi:hypothetical protein